MATLGSSNEPVAIRRTVYFSGQVQGVGFRYAAQAVATRFDVTGFVRNLADGRVQLVAEGLPSEVARFQSALKDRMHRYIASADVEDSPATGEYQAFSITF